MLDISKIAKILLYYVGIVRSEHQNFFGNIRIFLIVFFMGSSLILQALELTAKWESIETLGRADITPTLFKNLFTTIIYAMNRKDWKLLMKSIKNNFWDVKTLDLQFQTISESTQKTTAKFARVILMTMSSVFSMYAFAPAFMGRLPYEFYEFCDLRILPCYLANYAFAFCGCVSIGLTSIGFDMMFFHVIQTIYLELEAVKFYAEKLDCSRNLRVVKKDIAVLIEHHVLILSVIGSFRELIRIIFLFLYGTTTISICIGFFLITIDGIPPSMDSLTKNGVFLMSFNVQLLLYCIGGTILTEQTGAVSKVFYNMNWYDGHQAITKSASLVILRANKKEGLDIGGVILMNLELYPEVLKKAFSFYTLMDSMTKLK